MYNPKQKMSKNFYLFEFLKTNKQYVYDVTEQEIANIKKLCENLLQPIRDSIGHTISITTEGGLRPVKLNKLVGGSPTSDHIYGKAGDIDDPETSQIELFKNCCKIIREKSLKFKQIIMEYDSNCVHLSYDETNNKGEVLIRYRRNGKLVYEKRTLEEGISL